MSQTELNRAWSSTGYGHDAGLDDTQGVQQGCNKIALLFGALSGIKRRTQIARPAQSYIVIAGLADGLGQDQALVVTAQGTMDGNHSRTVPNFSIFHNSDRGVRRFWWEFA